MNQLELATLGAGCFWGVEDILMKQNGVTRTVCGYAGGALPNPTYRNVCTGETGHAEVVQVQFDPTVLSYQELLNLFFRLHDPTTLDRQGPDLGTQYRSVIFYHSEVQRKTALQCIDNLQKKSVFKDPIVTEVKEFKEFFSAEDYHQKYLEKNGGHSCHYLRPPLGAD